MILLCRWIEILLPWIYYLSSNTIYYFNPFLIKKNMQIELLPWEDEFLIKKYFTRIKSPSAINL